VDWTVTPFACLVAGDDDGAVSVEVRVSFQNTVEVTVAAAAPTTKRKMIVQSAQVTLTLVERLLVWYVVLPQQ